jgi:hypothetical protein
VIVGDAQAGPQPDRLHEFLGGLLEMKGGESIRWVLDQPPSGIQFEIAIVEIRRDYAGIEFWGLTGHER